MVLLHAYIMLVNASILIKIHACSMTVMHAYIMIVNADTIRSLG